jgi:hypothetical protein
MVSNQKRCTKTKKGQTEIFGLVIIVILVTMFFLFGVRQLLRAPEEDFKQSYTQKEVAQYFVSTFLSTTVAPCGNYQVRELILDCARNQNIYCEYGETSCSYLEILLDEYLNASLREWRKHYMLNISVEGGETLYYNDSRYYNDSYVRQFTRTLSNGTVQFDDRLFCLERRQGRAFLPMNPGMVEVTLDICTV